VAVLDWLQQLLGGGDPEAAGAAQASTAMQPATQPFVNLGRDLTNTLAVQPVTDAFGVFDRVLSGQGFTPEEALGVAALPIGGSAFGGGGGGLGAGIRAFHGSPHSFDRFDLSKIGTGEGAQAYGHGLYFAESEPVAQSYRDALTKPPTNHPLSDGSGAIPDWIANQIRQYPPGHEYYNSTIDNAKELFKGRIAEQDAMWPAQPWMAETNKKSLGEIIDSLDRMRSGDVTLAPLPKGHMYEVDINAKPEDFLNWDKRLGEQSPDVLDRLRRLDPGITPEGLVPRLGAPRSPAGSEWVNDLSGRSPAQTSEALGEAGIPGVRYSDQGSRGYRVVPPSYTSEQWRVVNHNNQVVAKTPTEQGVQDWMAQNATSNYAIWTPEIVTILRRYGLLPPLAAGGLLAAPGPGEAAPP
jgi:hypothetical protein